jgi:hypothetical protein
MQSNYDSLDDLESAVEEYERQHQGRWPEWLTTLILIALFALIFVVIVGEFAWGMGMSRQANRLAQQLTSVSITLVIPPTATQTVTATATNTLAPTDTPTYTPSPTHTMTDTPAVSETPSSTATNTYTPAPTNTSLPTPTNTPTQTPVDMSGIVKLSIWKELCPYNKLKYFDLPPVKIESISQDWMVELDGQEMVLKKIDAENTDRYALNLSVIDKTTRKPMAFQGTWGKGQEKARELSFKQCGPEGMDPDIYYWIPNVEEPAAPQGNYYFQITTDGNAVLANTEDVSVVTKSYYSITVDKLYLYPSNASDMACFGDCGDKNLKPKPWVCVMKVTDPGFYAVQWNGSRRLYWAKIEEITERPETCSEGVYTGITLLP